MNHPLNTALTLIPYCFIDKKKKIEYIVDVNLWI
jgi:hypothetical protein